MTIDAFASERHFIDHIAPVWRALDPAVRGRFVVPAHLRQHAAARHDITPSFGWVDRTSPVLVASWGDYRKTRPRPTVYLEHGAGQSYTAGDAPRHPSYSGGTGREQIGLYLAPSERVVEANRRHYPDTRYEVVGCPKLDPWVGYRPPAHERPVVAISFHFNAGVGDEGRGAFEHYASILPALAKADFDVIGHAHPRLMPRLMKHYLQAGIRCVLDFDDVLAKADLYVCDNSSTIYEFAATGRPVVVMNAPWYDRSREHGLRFWEYADVGVNVDGPDELIPAIHAALADTPARKRRRQAITRALYGVRDGTASVKAARAIERWLPEPQLRTARLEMAGGRA